MKAAVFNRAGEPFEIQVRPDPTPGEGQVVIKVGRCGICGSDLHMTENEGMGCPPSGTVMGHEISGEVIEIGKDVLGLKPGDLVAALPITGCGKCVACLSGEPSYCVQGMRFLAGGYAEYALAGVRECLKIPQGLSLDDGALVEPLAVALHGVRSVQGIAASKVTVLGAGPIGLGAVYWAHRFGASRIEVVEGNPVRARLALQMGATHVRNPDLERDPLAVMPDRDGPDFVFECVGRPGLLAAAISQVRPRGSVISLGFCVAPEQVLASAAAMREVRLVFPMLYTLDDYRVTLEAFEAGHVEPRLMLTGKTGLRDFPQVFEGLRKPGSDCKVMLDPSLDAG